MLERIRPCVRALAPSSKTFINPIQTRWVHGNKRPQKIPEPRPFIPDVPTFLQLIGRGMSKHAKKFPTWESLFALRGGELKELGIEPTRQRRYLQRWMQKFRKGDLGPGGDFEYVKDGEAILKVALPPAGVIGQKKYCVNVPHPDAPPAEPPTQYTRPLGYMVKGEQDIMGPGVQLMKGSGARVRATEGMWEDKLGRKIDGGERRRAEVRFKKRSAERRAEREAELLGKL